MVNNNSMMYYRRPLGGYDENGIFSRHIEGKKYSFLWFTILFIYYKIVHVSINHSSIGITYMGTVCNMCYKYGIVKDQSSVNERANTIAHESAHL